MRRNFFITYANKEEAKHLGLRWDAEGKTWYHPNTNAVPFDTFNMMLDLEELSKKEIGQTSRAEEGDGYDEYK